MRILHVTNWLPGCHHISGGAEAVCLNTIEMARQAGHECAVFCLPLDFPSPHPFPVTGADTLLEHVPRRLLTAVDFVRTLWRPVDGFAARSFARELRRFRPDLVHFHKFERLGYSLVPAAKRFGSPTIWSVYDYLAICPEGHLLRREGGYCGAGQGRGCYDCYHPGRLLPGLQRALWRRRPGLIHRHLRLLDHVVVLSERCGEIMREHGIAQDKLRVIHQPYAVADTTPPPAAEVDANLVFFAGWLAHVKGLHVALQAMAEVVQHHPAAHLLALGMTSPEAGYQQVLDDLLDRHHLREQVTLLGRVPRAEFLDHLRRAAVVVVPEQWENMSPVIIVEAMANAKPVVASAVGGIPEFVQEGETGHLAAAADPAAFARGLLQVLQDPAGAAAMGAAGRARALALFDRSVIEKRLGDLYRECVAGPTEVVS